MLALLANLEVPIWNRNIFRLWMSLGLMLATWPSQLSANTNKFTSSAISADELSITFKGDTSVIYEFGDLLSPLGFCHKLKELLDTPKSGPFFRPFAKSNCLGEATDQGLKIGQWLLEIDAQSSPIRLRLLFQSQAGIPPAELALVTFMENSKLDEQNLQLVLAEIFDQSPMLARVTEFPAVTTSKPAKLGFSCQSPVSIAPPTAVFIYHLDWSNRLKIFQPIIVATGTIDKSSECPSWNLKSTGIKPQPGKTLFLHNKQGLGKGGYSKNFTFKSADDPSKNEDFAKVGLTYSHPIKKDLQTGMLAKTKIFSLFMELRSGKFKGLRAYLDYMPKAAGVVSETGANTSISFQRYVFGYAFTIKPWDKQLRFDIIPKLGIWNLRSDLPLYSGIESTPPEVLPFDLKFKPAGNLELDAEYEPFSSFVTRVYVSSGIGIGLSTDKDRTLVSSQRIGAELTWSPISSNSSQKYKLGYIASAFQEANTLKKVDTPEDPNVPYIGDFSYSQTYVSGGVVVGW